MSRLDEIGRDPRFRLTSLGGGRYGLSLYERNRWQPSPYESEVHEMVAMMNTDLAAWAAEWPSPYGHELTELTTKTSWGTIWSACGSVNLRMPRR